MILDVSEVFQLGCNFMDNHPLALCAHFVELSLYFQFNIVFHDLKVLGSFQMKVWTLMSQRNLMIPGIG